MSTEAIFRSETREGQSGPLSEALAVEGAKLARAGRLAEAAVLFERAADGAPENAEHRINVGVANMGLGRLDAAQAAFEEAARLAPGHPALASNRAMLALARNDDPLATVAAFEKALVLNRGAPDEPVLLNNLGVALRRIELFAPAENVFREALAIAPGYSDAAGNLALTLIDLLRTDEALDVLDAALAHAPGSAALHARRAHALKERGQVDEAAEALAMARALAPSDPTHLHGQVLLAHYREGLDAAALRRLHATCEQVLPSALRMPATVRPDRPLRVGYVSGDLRRHPVGFLMQGVIPHHDARRVQPFVYATHPVRDEVTRAICTEQVCWRDAHVMSNSALERAIGDDDIDLLIDLAGHTAHNRLAVMARRPAPVQATWLGYVGTTGLSAIDWLIADAAHVPEGEEVHHVEKVMRLPGGHFCWTPPQGAPEVGRLPAASGEGVTFGSFNNVAKLSRGVVALWSSILRHVPGSRLVLLTKTFGDPGVARRYREMFALHGVTADRLDFRGELAQPDLLAAYGGIDIALDPFPYSGGVTTLEALWMGVPVITCPGAGFASRHATSHLANAHHPELVTPNFAEYEALAIELAADLGRLAGLRACLRSDLRRSRLLDHVNFTRGLEAAFEDMVAARS